MLETFAGRTPKASSIWLADIDRHWRLFKLRQQLLTRLMAEAIFAFSASIKRSKSGFASSSGKPALARISARSFFALSSSSTSFPTRETSLLLLFSKEFRFCLAPQIIVYVSRYLKKLAGQSVVLVWLVGPPEIQLGFLLADLAEIKAVLFGSCYFFQCATRKRLGYVQFPIFGQATDVIE